MKKELEHFNVDTFYGGSQKWFSDAWMKIGGCGAVTACDVCIYLARYMGMKELYPYDPFHVTMEDYLKFGMQMKPFLSPRMHGINKTSTYINGFTDYLVECGSFPIRFDDLQGDAGTDDAIEAVRTQIDLGFPVPYLMLLHRDKKLDDYMWHWFLLNGYDDEGKRFKVKVVTYGEAKWMDLLHLWRTDRKRKGGIVLIRPNQAEQDVPAREEQEQHNG